MHILIPASGGLDSAALLWRTLTETDHAVTAIHYTDEPTTRDMAERTRETRAFRRVIDWISSHGRAVDTLETTVVAHAPDGTPFDPGATEPVREGFAQRRKNHWLRCRYATHGHAAADLKPDEVWLALNAWNCRSASHAMHLGDYRARTNIPLRLPFFAGDGDNPPQDGATGRFEIAATLPAELRALTILCGVADEPCGGCRRCLINRFYAEVCAGLAADDIKRIDDRLARLGQYGRHAALADPAQYDYTRPYHLMANTAVWHAWIASGMKEDE